MGAAHSKLLRRIDPDYYDGVSEMAGEHRPGPREISNAVAAQKRSIPNRLRASDYLWQWGQFLDHDIGLTDGTHPAEPAPIPVPEHDKCFVTGTMLPFNRSIYDKTSGTDEYHPRQQLNEISAWIDASNVYGSDPERAAALRTNDETGKLRTSEGDLLPFNDAEDPDNRLPNAGGPDSSLFLAGDVRANEQVALTALHTLFVREHNRLCDLIRATHRRLDGNAIYQRARRIVGAQMQVITYREFLPALLGNNALAPYRGYDPSVNAQLANHFAHAAFRFGHSLLSPKLLRLDEYGNEIPEGHLPLRHAFFSPEKITREGGIAPLLRGLAHQVCQAADSHVIDDVRNFLFAPPDDGECPAPAGTGGFDLVALNIQRGRDHGLPGYNATRVALGLASVKKFKDVTSNRKIRRRLRKVYDSVDDIDLWVGGLAEDPLPGALVGELLHTVIKEQFEALRDGDRFWYQRSLSRHEINKVEDTRLSDIIRRNTEIGNEISSDVFHVDQK